MVKMEMVMVGRATPEVAVETLKVGGATEDDFRPEV
jgi:hypothetical protein